MIEKAYQKLSEPPYYYRKNAKFSYFPVKYRDFKEAPPSPFLNFVKTPAFLFKVMESFYHNSPKDLLL